MDRLEFEWDERKNAANRKKHGISFEEAKTVFADDQSHSDEEDRFIILGMSAATRVLVVCHCYREAADRIRIISARKANRLEQDDYLKVW